MNSLAIFSGERSSKSFSAALRALLDAGPPLMASIKSAFRSARSEYFSTSGPWTPKASPILGTSRGLMVPKNW